MCSESHAGDSRRWTLHRAPWARQARFGDRRGLDGLGALYGAPTSSERRVAASRARTGTSACGEVSTESGPARFGTPGPMKPDSLCCYGCRRRWRFDLTTDVALRLDGAARVVTLCGPCLDAARDRGQIHDPTEHSIASLGLALAALATPPADAAPHELARRRELADRMRDPAARAALIAGGDA